MLINSKELNKILDRLNSLEERFIASSPANQQLQIDDLNKELNIVKEDVQFIIQSKGGKK